MNRKIIPDLIKGKRPTGEGRVCELPEDSTAHKAAQQMGRCHVAAIAITNEDGKLIGIVTERDLTRRVMGEGLDPRKTKLSEIMSRNLLTLNPEDDAIDAVKLMAENHCRHLPVVDGKGRIVAMMSIRHLYQATQQDMEDDMSEYRAFVFDSGYSIRH
ncbi:MAG: CBS domain-containing protein [Rhodospirillales bacterium]|nr:CBS domain-containing protein [Rhodospirillales bacterium]